MAGPGVAALGPVGVVDGVTTGLGRVGVGVGVRDGVTAGLCPVGVSDGIADGIAAGRPEWLPG